MVKRYDVNSVRSPGGRYSHVGEIGPGGRVFHLAGQTGTAPDGTTPEGIEAQSRQVYQNIASILEECGMGLENLVKVTIYLTDMGNFPKIVDARKKYFTPPFPADTIVEVKALALPELMVEIDVIAAA